MKARLVISVVISLLATDAFAGKADYMDFPSGELRFGKSVWLLNCETCHAYGIADAPIPMDPADWRPRLDKGMTVLYAHAVNGYFGPDDSMMPARGGNEKLSDKEVRAAVDYMVELAKYYIDMKRGKAK